MTASAAPFTATLDRVGPTITSATVNDGTPVYDIADLQPLYVDVQVPERQVARPVHVGLVHPQRVHVGVGLQQLGDRAVGELRAVGLSRRKIEYGRGIAEEMRTGRLDADRLAHAVAGDPDLVAGGTRSDFGYVGDIGALPSDWDDLVTNPGYSTWNGPYVQDEFAS